jgi:hypothetical protein
LPKKDAEEIPIKPSLRLPAPWKSWDPVRAVRDNFKCFRRLMARKSTEFSCVEQKALDIILGSPIADKYKSIYLFVKKCCDIWRADKLEKIRERCEVAMEIICKRQINRGVPSLG